ncbi:hypothetical protein JOS77_18425 [Chromobacterium haemolyticum]|nr:hypothetical protein JOS77_18425 [Chromobacterium haemolyticum]
MIQTWLMRRSVRMPDAGAARQRFAHEFVGVQAALHQNVGVAFAHQGHRLFGGGMAVRHVDQLKALQVHFQFVGQLGQPGGGGDQNGSGDAVVGCLHRAQQRFAAAGVGHGHRQRAQANGLLEDVGKSMFVASHCVLPQALM